MSKSVPTLSALFLALALSQPATSQVASWTSFGAGCAGSQGVPLLAPMQNSLPFVGEAFWSEVSNLPLSPGLGLGVGLVGLSDQNWLGGNLPANLGTLLFMPGCLLYTDIRRTTNLSFSGGRVSWPLVIPNMSSLHGVTFFQQAFIVDPLVPGLGAVMSNAARSVIENFSGNLTVRVLGGTTGDIPQVGVRVLRHDLGTGAVLDDQLTGVDGVVNFGAIGTSRTTFSVVVPPPFPFTNGKITTVMNARVGDLTVLSGPEPGLQASFNVDVVGVPLSTDQAIVMIGAPDEGDYEEPVGGIPPTINFSGIELRYLQSDGNVSILAQAAIDGSGVTACGMMLDVNPATIAPGSTLFIPTNIASTDVPFTANEPVLTLGLIARRKGLIFENEFLTDPQMSGDFPVCALPDADKYGFFFIAADARGAGLLSIHDTIPASINVTMPDLSSGLLNRDAGTRSFNWAITGSDVSGLDFAELYIEWDDPMTSSNLIWTLIMAPDSTRVNLPQLPDDLSIFEPPVDTAFADLEMLDLDVVNGYDDFITAISATGGNLVTLAFTGSLLKVVITPE